MNELTPKRRKELEAEFRAWYVANNLENDRSFDYTSGEKSWIAARTQNP